MKEDKIFWIHFEKEDKGLRLSKILRVLEGFNKLFTALAEHNDFISGELEKSDFEPILIDEIRPGCRALGVQLISPPSYPTTVDKGDPFDKIIHQIKDLFGLIKDKSNYNQLKKDIPKEYSRVALFHILKYICPTNENIKITYNGLKEDFTDDSTIVELTDQNRGIINEWLKSEQIKSFPNIMGLIEGMRITSDVFYLITDNNQIINCKMEMEELMEIKKYIGYLSRVYGDYRETPGRRPLISNIDKVEPICKKSDFLFLKEGYKPNIQMILSECNENTTEPRYSNSTIDKALRYLAKLREKCYEQKIDLLLPKLFPGNDSDIHLEWANDLYELVIGISGDDQYGIYGIDKNKIEIEKDGELYDIDEELLTWIKNTKK